jgi:hypothetical protein
MLADLAIEPFRQCLDDLELRSQCHGVRGYSRRVLQTAFLNEARPDRRNVRLGIAKRVRRRVDGVVPEDEIVPVRSGRAEDELGIGQRLELDRFT